MATKTAPVAPREGAVVEVIDGSPFVRVTRALWSEPTVCTWWYPVARTSRESALSLAGVALVERDGGSAYAVSAEAPEWRASRDARVFLAKGSGTEPVRFVETPAARPSRVRSELKWEHGRWHKLTKRGWRPA